VLVEAAAAGGHYLEIFQVARWLMYSICNWRKRFGSNLDQYSRPPSARTHRARSSSQSIGSLTQSVVRMGESSARDLIAANRQRTQAILSVVIRSGVAGVRHCRQCVPEARAGNESSDGSNAWTNHHSPLNHYLADGVLVAHPS